MEKEILEKVEMILESILFENLTRSSRLHTNIVLPEEKSLADMQEEYETVIDELDSLEKEQIKKYIEQLRVVSFAEQKETYLQGYIDAILSLGSLGIINISISDLKNIIGELKK